MLNRPKVIGLTGGIGTGKTTVGRILADLGATIVNADLVGHEVYAPGTPGWQQVRDRFGADVVAADGTIDRRRLGAIVFADAQALADLNGIVHPLIGNEIARRVSLYLESGSRLPLVLEAALLVDAGWTAIVDEVWVVVAPETHVVERVRHERGMEDEQTRARIRAQVPEATRRARADVVIENSGSLADLDAKVRAEWARVSA